MIAVTNPGSTQSYSPCFAVAKGWDGTSPVFLINGTSREVPTSDVVYRQAQRGVTSAIMRGLDSTTGGRLAFGDFSQSGAYALNTASEAPGAFAARMAALRAIGNEDAGYPGKWKVPGVSGTLQADVSAGALSCSVDLAAVAELGESLVVDAERLYVSSTTGPASSQTIGTHSKFTTAHGAATVVRTAYTTDGVHQAAPLMASGGAYIAGLKVSGVIH